MNIKHTEIIVDGLSDII